MAGEVVTGFTLGVVGVGASKAGKPKGAGSELRGSEIDGSWVRMSANRGSKDMGASVGWTSAWTGETSIPDAASGLAIGSLGAERGSEGEGGNDGVAVRTASGGAAVLQSDSGSEESVKPGAWGPRTGESEESEQKHFSALKESSKSLGCANSQMDPVL